MDNQPWDVGSDGRVVYVLGEPFGSNCCAAGRLRAEDGGPDGNPDFEPAVLAMTDTGAIKWWSRLYHEMSADGKSVLNSTPDQYIDGLAVDQITSALVVLARCHGNNISNYWSGNAVALHPGTNSFQNTFTGTNGNIHI